MQRALIFVLVCLAVASVMAVTQPPTTVVTQLPIAPETPTMPASVPDTKAAPTQTDGDSSQDSIIGIIANAVRQLKVWASTSRPNQEQQPEQEQEQAPEQEPATPEDDQASEPLGLQPLEQAAPAAPQVRSWQFGPFTFVTSTRVESEPEAAMPRAGGARVIEDESDCAGDEDAAAAPVVHMAASQHAQSPIAALIQRARAALHARMAEAARQAEAEHEAEAQPSADREEQLVAMAQQARFQQYWQHVQAQRQELAARARAFWEQIRQQRLARLAQKYGADGAQDADAQVVWALGGGALGPVLTINGDAAPVSPVAEAKAADPAALIEQQAAAVHAPLGAAVPAPRPAPVDPMVWVLGCVALCGLALALVAAARPAPVAAAPAAKSLLAPPTAVVAPAAAAPVFVRVE